MDPRPTVRVFISSPDDVRPERLLAERIIARLDGEFLYHFRVESLLYEREPLVATHHFQDPRNIPPPHKADIVIVILWSKLGSLLPEDHFRGAISNRPVTGTEWEFEDALNAARAGGVPELLLYRKTKDVSVSLKNDPELERQRGQMRLVEDFMGRWFGLAASGPAIAASHRFETPQEFEEKLYEHLRALLDRRVRGGDPSVAIRWHEAPFRGLLSFDLQQAPVFFGRTKARNEVREMLASAEARRHAFVLILGASGSGKSSLVKAGVLPDLMLPGMIGRVALCRYAIVRPSDHGSDAIAALAASILSDTALPELKVLGYTTDRVAGLLREGPLGAVHPIEQGVAEARKAARLTEIAEARLLLIIDQLEEIFTIPGLSDGDRSGFFAALGTLARSGLVWVIATMRSDFFDRLEAAPALGMLAEPDSRYLLLPPTDAEIGQMIREPAREAGLRFEIDPTDGVSLDERIREAARNREALPLLSFVLDELWKARTDDGLLTFEAYRRLGGLEGALARRAEAVFGALPDLVQATLPRILRALATIGREGQIASKPAPLSAFGEGTPERRFIDAFASPDARLFVKSTDQTGAEAKIRVAHEALLTHWQRARECLEENRSDIQLEARLHDAAMRWDSEAKRDRKSLLLASGLPIEEATDLVRRRETELSKTLLEFIAQSESAVKRNVRRRQVVAAVVMLSLAVLAVASVVALYLAERERNGALIAQSRFLARDSGTATDQNNATLGMLLALNALPQSIANPDRPFVTEAGAALEKAFAAQRQRAVLHGHDDRITSTTFSPDGNKLLTTSRDKTARLWDARTGDSLAVLRGHSDAVLSAAFSSDGSRLITASRDSTARVWDAKNGEALQVLRGHTGAVFRASFSPDGARIVTAASDGTTRLWDARSGTMITTLHDFPVRLYSAAFSPKGSRIVTTSFDGTAKLWDGKTGALTAMLTGHRGPVFSAVFSADETRILTGSWDQTARLWDARTTALLAVLPGHDTSVDSLAFSPDGTRVLTAGSIDGTARLWDGRTGRLIAALPGNYMGVKSVAFSPDSMRAMTGDWHAARSWDATTGAPLEDFNGGDDDVEAVLSPDGRGLATASGKIVRLWDTTTRSPVTTLRADDIIGAAALSPDGTQVVGVLDHGQGRVWNSTSGATISELRGHDSSPFSAAFSPDGRRVVTGHLDKTATVWDTRTGTRSATLSGHGDAVTAAVFSPDGERIVTASRDKTARVWNSRTGKVIRVLSGHLGEVGFARFSPDGSTIVTASEDKTARLWDSAKGTTIAVLRGHRGAVTKAQYSGDGERIVTVSDDNTARVWNGRTGAPSAVLRGHEATVRSASFSPDATRVVTASDDKTARVWNTNSGSLVFVLRGHDNYVSDAVFLADGTRIATSSFDGTVRFWDARNGAQIKVVRPAGKTSAMDFLGSIAVSSDGTRMMTPLPLGRTLLVWDATSLPLPRCQHLIDLLHSILTRELTPLEREREFLDQPEYGSLPHIVEAGDACQ